tara:strand:+ start:2182 stop:2769 length:588 start_codon:yes stop_codon:yes gene_type:complete
MFTGIIQTQGKISWIEDFSKFKSVAIESNLRNFDIGSSICCSGICLTATSIKKNIFTADISNETLKKTNSKFWKKGNQINLEKSLKIGDEVSGHFVFGHVDTTGQLKNIKKIGKSWMIQIEFPAILKKFIVTKGSISLNGISLTINEVKSNKFNCMIIPHTFNNTDIQHYKKNQILNLEVDMLARYAQSSNFNRR